MPTNKITEHYLSSLIVRLRRRAFELTGTQSANLMNEAAKAIYEFREYRRANPALPAGWKIAPRDPDEEMIIRGFESEPDESFSTPEDWERYEKMSGCEQAAHRVKLSWTAMFDAIPPIKD